MSKSSRLRELLQSDEPLIVPGVWDALTAMVAEQSGFEALFLTGHGVSVATLGLSDFGFSGLQTVADATRAIVRGSSLPLIVDADTGYGSPLGVIHTVRELENAGAAGIMLEDQVWPKKCGHFEGKEIISAEEMVAKFEAATYARSNPDLVLVARTDSIATDGIDEAVRRLTLYRDAGADVLFADAVETVEQMKMINSVAGTTMVNMVENGKTPILPKDEVAKIGYDLVVYAGTGMFCTIKSLQDAWGHLVAKGDTREIESDLVTFKEFQEVTGLPELLEQDKKFSHKAS